MDLILPRLGWLPVDDNLPDDEAHAGETGRLRGVAPHGVAEDVVNPAYQADEIVNGRLRVGAAHLLVESAKNGVLTLNPPTFRPLITLTQTVRHQKGTIQKCSNHVTLRPESGRIICPSKIATLLPQK